MVTYKRIGLTLILLAILDSLIITSFINIITTCKYESLTLLLPIFYLMMIILLTLVMIAYVLVLVIEAKEVKEVKEHVNR